MKLKALIFDVDGTLANTERDGHRLAFNMAFEEAGLDWRWSESLYGELLTVTGGKERILYYANEHLEGFQWPADRDSWVRNLHRTKTNFYLAMLERGIIPLRPGVRELITEAKEAGLQLAIATTTTPANVTCLLNANLGDTARHWFTVIAAGDIVANKKPAPDVYLMALDQMGLDAAECMAFEDSGPGLRSAKGAGLKTIIAINSYTAGDDFSGADLVIDNWGTADRGFKVISGEAGSATFLDLGLVREIHGR